MEQTEKRPEDRNPLRRAVRAARRLITRTKHAEPVQQTEQLAKPAQTARSQPRSRPVRREADIPFDTIAGSYTPTQTSLKAPFRADGADHHRDQEYGRGPEDDRWNDEDLYTNKSGDPRIGTHGRTYEGRRNDQEGESEWTKTAQ